MKTKLLEFNKLILNAPSSALEMSLDNVHAPDLFSLVFHCDENKRLKRAFMAGTEIAPYDIQLHTHRYPLRITVIQGTVTHHRAVEVAAGHTGYYQNRVFLDSMSYRSAIVPGEDAGKVEVIGENVELSVSDFVIPPGASIELTEHDIHTVSCSAKAIWIVEELPIEKPCEITKMYGVPFKTISMYEKPLPVYLHHMHNVLVRAIQVLTRFY